MTHFAMRLPVIATIAAAITAPAHATVWGAPSQARTDNMLVYGHMGNTAGVVSWLVEQGANAIEADLVFSSSAAAGLGTSCPSTSDADCAGSLGCGKDSNSDYVCCKSTSTCWFSDCCDQDPPAPAPVAAGVPAEFSHGGFCDCSNPLFFFGAPSNNVCSQMSCNSGQEPRTLLERVAAHKEVRVMYVDSKVDGLGESTLQLAGANVVALLDQSLFGAGFDGQALVGIGSSKDVAYLRAAAGAANASPNVGRIFFTIDMMGDDAAGTIATLASLGTPNIVYSTGISSLSPSTFYDGIAHGYQAEMSGNVAGTTIWTLDSKSSMLAYLQKGANAIMTNQPSEAVSAIASYGGKLAPPGSLPLRLRAEERPCVVVSCSSDMVLVNTDSNGCGGECIALYIPPTATATTTTTTIVTTATSTTTSSTTSTVTTTSSTTTTAPTTTTTSSTSSTVATTSFTTVTAAATAPEEPTPATPTESVALFEAKPAGGSDGSSSGGAVVGVVAALVLLAVGGAAFALRKRRDAAALAAAERTVVPLESAAVVPAEAPAPPTAVQQIEL